MHTDRETRGPRDDATTLVTKTAETAAPADRAFWEIGSHLVTITRHRVFFGEVRVRITIKRVNAAGETWTWSEPRQRRRTPCSPRRSVSGTTARDDPVEHIPDDDRRRTRTVRALALAVAGVLIAGAGYGLAQTQDRTPDRGKMAQTLIPETSTFST
ncbi:hypothetical protein U9R90_28510 [Streptomyces sp. E11-3]|uniref:hypothetical protein n=1 Tax=Streptomyces sp. E11-3 TaxID=3110112 RepID=UPI0039818E94